MKTIIIIKCNGFFDVISSDIEISKDYIDLEVIDSIIEEYDNCILKLSNIKISYDSGQFGEYGRYEIEPYYTIDDCKIKKLCDIFNYMTKSEKKYIAESKAKKRVEKLQKYVSSFSTNEVKYTLCIVWASDRVALRQVDVETFNVYKTIHEFQSNSTSNLNLYKIKSWVNEYFKTVVKE